MEPLTQVRILVPQYVPSSDSAARPFLPHPRRSCGATRLWRAGLSMITLFILALEWSGLSYAQVPALPLKQRAFLMGTTPLPGVSRDFLGALKLVASTGELIMYWPAHTGIGFLNDVERAMPGGGTYVDAVRRMGLEPVLNLNPWTVAPGRGIVRNDGSASSDFGAADFQRQMVHEAAEAARRFHPAYFCIGNEVNSVAQMLGARAFADLIRLEQRIYRAIKTASPRTKVIVVISWSQLVDGPASPDYSLVGRVSAVCDVVGLTTYPWRRYATPDAIPPNYYRCITSYTSKPIAFTEIGWSSDPSQGGSERAQARFLVRFLELTRGMPLEFVHWAFLHDLSPAAVGDIAVQRTHLGLGLRRYDGTPKPVWQVWCNLHALPRARATPR